MYVHTVNSLVNLQQFAFKWLINEFGGLTGYSVVRICTLYLVMGSLGRLKDLADKAVVDNKNSLYAFIYSWSSGCMDTHVHTKEQLDSLTMH